MQGGNNGELDHDEFALSFRAPATGAKLRNIKHILEPRDAGAIPSAMLETPSMSKTHPN